MYYAFNTVDEDSAVLCMWIGLVDNMGPRDRNRHQQHISITSQQADRLIVAVDFELDANVTPKVSESVFQV